MQYDQMNEAERQAFAGLVRLMARMDGVFSKEEAHEIAVIAAEIGARDIWQRLNAAVAMERRDLVALVDQVRPDFHGWIVGHLTRLAEADGVDESERELLVWLENRWGLARAATA